ncbi:uncharacterized protein LOC100370032 [Saccoglossus kowalevskii]|uniref:Uncharacterized protein LOC100370032 n=1 Tax=Saccoglossus kowalevskii TaxID=10224 RepID=A0ABM0GZ96_SACKO|nr:PREDICTED: uncharacterized protein LOC100370032 [Saccoglossus kowalevskii]
MAEPKPEGSGITELGSETNTTDLDLAPERTAPRPAAPVEKRINARAANNGSVRMKLKKVDEYEVKDAQMNAVFGVAPRDVKNTLKVNPLYDQGTGVIEVSESDAQNARSKRPNDDGSHRNSRADSEEGEAKIGYSTNFMLGRTKQENGEVKKQENEKRLKTQGRVMPSRIHRNASLSSMTPNGASNGYYKDEESYRSSPPDQRTRRWRLIMLLILIILILALVLVLVLYFLTQGIAR